MQPLEGLYYFTQVVEHGGYARAARALDIPKSRLSRHVAALETKLNVRLVNRSTRRFAVTEVGQEVYRHALAMLAEADAALEAVEFARAEPRGTIRVSCPVAIAQWGLATHLPEFLAKYPGVRLHLHVSNRRVDVLAEGFDLAVRVRSLPSGSIRPKKRSAIRSPLLSRARFRPRPERSSPSCRFSFPAGTQR